METSAGFHPWSSRLSVSMTTRFGKSQKKTPWRYLADTPLRALPLQYSHLTPLSPSRKSLATWSLDLGCTMLANLISDRSIHLLWSLITRDGHAPLFPMRISAYWHIYAWIFSVVHFPAPAWPSLIITPIIFLATEHWHDGPWGLHRQHFVGSLRDPGVQARYGSSLAARLWIPCDTWWQCSFTLVCSNNCDKIHPVRKETMYDCCVNPFVDITYTIRCQIHIFWFSAYCPDMIFVKSLQQLIFHNHTIWCQHIHFGPFFYQVVMNVDWFVYSGSIRKERCLLCSKPRDGDCEVL